MKDFKMSEIEWLHIYGRTNKNKDPLTLYWTASGFEVNVKASEMWIEVEAEYNIYEPWISVLIDGEQISRQMIVKGRYWIPLFRNLNKDIERKIRILRDVQAMSGDPESYLKIHSIRLDGQFAPMEDKKMRIEFVGDSITSGEGTIGAHHEMDWVSMVFSGVQNYTTITADALNADYHVISQSGWGIISGWDGDPACSIPKYYDQVCGLTSKGKNALSGAGDEYDFASWQPDVIVVNLGTNDDSAFHQPAVFYDEDGHLFDQKVEEDGFYEKKSVQRLEKGIERFLKKIRRYNPNSYILWAYGMLGTPLESVIKEALNKYKIQNEDTKISFIELEAATSDTIGSREHPGYLCHRKAAEILIKEITNLMNS